MSWLFSRALVEEYLAGSCSAGEQCAPLNTNPTPPLFLPKDKMTAFSRLSRFGMTFGHLTDDLGAGVLTWFLAGFPARISASPVPGKGLTAKDRGCGQKWPALLARYDPDSRLWRTAQRSLLAGLDVFSETWPRWGSMRNGECWERQTLAHRTAGKESGSWRTPTPTASMMTVADMEQARYAGNKGGNRPSYQDAKKNAWPTPRASDRKGATSPDAMRKAISRGFYPNLPEAISASVPGGGKLNPEWTEWLMGWPIGWTDLKPLATGKCRNARLRHGGC